MAQALQALKHVFKFRRERQVLARMGGNPSPVSREASREVIGKGIMGWLFLVHTNAGRAAGVNSAGALESLFSNSQNVLVFAGVVIVRV